MSAADPAGGRVDVRRARELVAGVLRPGPTDSAEAEAWTVLAHACGVPRSVLAGRATLSAEALDRALGLARRRAETGEPLQYVLGVAPSGALDLAVGPGVFIPRPETELLVERALAALPAVRVGTEPLVVDLCAGSGTIALEVAHARPDARVVAVELEPAALGWLRRNAEARAAAGDRAIDVVAGDATDPDLLAGLRGRVDVVTANPPYIPANAPLPREVADFEPHSALFGGADGLAVIRPLAALARRLLRDGGALLVEHDDATSDAVRAVLEGDGGFGTVDAHIDLAGRPRFVSARRRTAPGPRASRESG